MTPGDAIARRVVRQPLVVLAIAFAVAAALVPLVLRLRLDTDLVDLVPQRTPGASAFARYTRAFASEQALVVVIESSDGAKLLDFGERYAEALRKMPGVDSVRARLGADSSSLVKAHLLELLDDDEIDALAARTTPEALAAQARRLRGRLSAPGGSALAPLVTADPLDLLSLVAKRLSAGLPVDTTSGWFRSRDGTALLVFVQPTTGPFDIEADRALLDGARARATQLGARLAEGDWREASATPTVGFTGSHAYALEYRDWLHRDMQLSTVISGVMVLLFFAVLLGALRALPIVALPLGLSLWLTAGAAAAMYGRVNAVSLAFSTLLVSIGIDLPIQLYSRLRLELDALTDGETPELALERTIARLAGPSLLATLGPAAVFFCCALSEYRGLGELGVLAGAGLLVNLVTMLTVLPALLALVPARWWAPRRRVATQSQWFAALGRLAGRRPRTVLLCALAVAAAAAPGATRLRYDRRLISIEPASMKAARTARELERRFGNKEQMLIGLVEDRDPDRALSESDAWRAEAERLRRAGLVDSYETVSNLFPSLATQAERRARLAKLDPARIARELRQALESVGFDVAPFAGFLEQLEHAPPPLRLADAPPELAFLVKSHVHDGDRGRMVATFLFPTPGQATAARAALEAFVDGHAGSSSLGELTGVPILEDALRRVVERDTVRVSLASVIAVLLVLVVYYRRARPVLAVLGPLSLAWLLFAAALGLADIPLNLFNLLAVPLVVGYGIDDHVFLVHRHLEHPGRGPHHALASTGRAIVVTSLSTIAGFAGLGLARFDGLRLLGTSGALAVALCLLAAFAVLPALLALLWPATSPE